VQLLQWFSGLTLIFTLALLVFVGFAFVDAAIRPASSYVAAGKLTKQAWLLILGVAFACAFAFGVVSFVGAATIVAALVYSVDVRPALIAVRGGGGSNQGPYGPW
jgi:hypothetical protein